MNVSSMRFVFAEWLRRIAKRISRPSKTVIKAESFEVSYWTTFVSLEITGRNGQFVAIMLPPPLMELLSQTLMEESMMRAIE